MRAKSSPLAMVLWNVEIKWFSHRYSKVNYLTFIHISVEEIMLSLINRKSINRKKKKKRKLRVATHLLD